MVDDMNSALVHGTYCASLRDRPIWNAIGPVLTQPSTRLEERNLGLFDLNVRLQSRPEHVNVLLLSESSIDSSTKPDTLSRLKQIIDTAPQQAVVAFLLSEGSFANASEKYQLDGLLSLQILMVESLTQPLSIIPVPNASCLLSCLYEYLSNRSDIPRSTSSAMDPRSLLAHVRSAGSRSLFEYETNILSDIFPSLRALSQAVRTEDGQRLLSLYFGEDRAREIITFWEEDTLYQ